MKYLNTYKELNLENNNDKIFSYFISTLQESIFTWNYFVEFNKVKKNINNIEIELNLLNVLIGKKDIDNEFIKLIETYPNTRKILPILIAIRNNKIKETRIINDFETLISEDKEYLFNPKVELNQKNKQELILFFNESGLKNIFQDKNIKNVVDYCFGIEVGMDTNARKNRTGEAMEYITEKIIETFCKKYELAYIPQATKTKIKELWNFNIELDKIDRRFDFAIYNKKKNKLIVLETNFYGGSGSKLKATAGEYKSLFDFLKQQNIELVWVTDGLGWKTTEKALYETFIHNDYLFNIELLKKEILKEIIL